MPKTKKPRVALVIGSGSVKCAAALGLWKSLDRAGIPIDMLVGCSGGSLYASTMSLGFTLDECIQYTARLWNKDVTLKRNWNGILGAVFPSLFNFGDTFGMVSDKLMLGRLNQVYGEKTFADTKIPLTIMATDFYSGEMVTLAEGKLVDAIRASIAIPFVWSAHKVGGRTLIDGSASNPMPVDVAIKEGAEVILAMGFQSPLPTQVKSISRYAFHINGIMTNSLYHSNFAFHNAAHHAEIIPIFPEFDRPIRLFDTDQIPYVLDQGEKATEAQIPYIRKLLNI
ncbi:MAG: patatin-like phospholipase family protein [Chloroflexi bacterium]|nr:patatin-like phospholipase family protein [Chloroflexota bacterium]